MEKKNQNRETWCGYRPSVMPAKKKNKKHERKQGKQICRNAMKGGEGLMINWDKYCIYFQEWCAGNKTFNTQEEADEYYKIWIEGFNYAREEFY